MLTDSCPYSVIVFTASFGTCILLASFFADGKLCSTNFFLIHALWHFS